MMSLFIWSVAHRWYWPNTLPQEVGFEYWKQALGLRTSLAIGAISIIPAFLLSLAIAGGVRVLAHARTWLADPDWRYRAAAGNRR